MKRDLDFVRAILLDVEQRDKAFSYTHDTFEGKSFNELAYHVDMLIHKGFLDGKVEYAWSGDAINVQVKAITWDGVDFLDTMRSDNVWDKTKETLRKSVGQTTFEVIKRVGIEVCTQMALNAIGVR